MFFGDFNPQTNKAEGTGTYFYENGYTYIGLWNNGSFNSLGEFIYSDLSVHSGSWTAGIKDGPFSFVDSSGTQF